MIRVVDLTRPVMESAKDEDSQLFSSALRQVHLKSASTQYTGMVFTLTTSSMAGTYIDFPGHILETDTALDAASATPEQYYRIPALVVHLDRESESGAVTAADLQKAAGYDASEPVPHAEALVINALGKRNPRDIANRSVWLDASAVQWVIDTGCKLLVSDIFESRGLEGVFLQLFSAGISTVCEPVNLIQLPGTGKGGSSQVRLSVGYVAAAGVKQIPCRLVGEIEE